MTMHDDPDAESGDFFDGLPMGAPQVMLIIILIVAYFFQQFSNWAFTFLALPILKSHDLTGAAGNAVVARITLWYFVGMTLGGVAGGLASDRWGRRRAMLGSMLIIGVAVVATGLARDMNLFVVARAATGFGVFALMVVSNTYIAEMAPASSRGRWQCGITAVGFSAVPVSAYVGKVSIPLAPDAWRYILVLGGLIVVPFILGLTYLKESPRWLADRGRRKEAEGIIEEFTGYAVELARYPEPAGKRPWPALLEMFSRQYLRSTFMLILVFVFMTPAGFIATFWLPQILSNVLPLEDTAELVHSISFGIPAGGIIGLFVTELGGRRKALFVLFLVSAAAMCGLAYASTRIELFGAGLAVNMLSIASSFVLFSYAAEQFPTRFRNSAAGILNGIGRFAVSGIQPLVLFIMSRNSLEGVYLLLAVLYVVAAPPLLLWGRNTAGVTLERTSAGER